jgi:hypothetical protein
VWLQEFAWTQKSLPSCLERRNHHLASSAKLAAQSMFCFGTALRLLYWSSLVYDYDEVGVVCVFGGGGGVSFLSI